MNDKMSLIYVTQTGNVLGAVTCNSDPKRQLSPADVATPQFLFEAHPSSPVGSNDFVSLSISASVLSVSPPMDFSEAVFQNPALFSVSGSTPNSLNAALPAPAAAWLTQTSVTIAIPAGNAVSVPTPVFVQLQETAPTTPPPNTLAVTGTIAANATQVILPLTASIPSNVDYSILVLVKGYEPFVVVAKA
jgi:hypothetical protein